jgi:hypothetical protein
MGCAKSDDSSSSPTTTTSDSTSSGGDGGTGGGTTGTNTPILSGLISSSSSTSSRTLSEARNFSHLLGRSSERSSYASAVSNCTAKAYDPKDDSLKATVTAADNGTYTFTDSQLTKGVMYRVSVECTYGGETVKMSTYGAASSSSDNATTADIDPQSTAAAAYVKKALVKAVVKALSSTTASGTVAEKREKTLTDVNSLVNNLQTTVFKNMSDGAMEYPDDPTKVTTLEAAVATSITSIVDSTTGASFETAMATVIDTQNEDWYVPPTMDSELAGAAAEGAAKLICAPWATTPDSNSDQEAQIKECAKIQAETSLLGLKFNLIIRNDDSSSKSALWGVASCNSTDFGFDDAVVKYELKTHNDSSTSCKITNRTQPESRNGDNQNDGGMTMPGKFYYILAKNLKKNTQYTLQDVNNMVFKKSGSGDDQIGWGAIWKVDLGHFGYGYTVEDGFKKCCDWRDMSFDNITGTSPTDTFTNKFAGKVPNWESVKAWVKNTKTDIERNSIQSETYVIIKEEPKRGKETNGDTNYCQDSDPATTCKTQAGNSIDDKKITVGLTFAKLSENDVTNNPQRKGFRYISGVGSKHTTPSKNQKNFYLRPLHDSNGATGAFGLVSAKNGRSLRNPWGFDVALVIVQNDNWCNSTTAKFNHSTDNGTALSLRCDNSVGKAIELWTSYTMENDNVITNYTIPKDNTHFITISDNDLVNELRDAKEYHFRRGGSLEYTFKCSLNAYDDCSGGATDEYPTHVSPLVYGDWGGDSYLKFSIASAENGTTITFDNSSGTYYAEESWDCSDSGCTQKFFFFPADAKNVNSEASSTDLILYRGDNDSDVSNTWFGVKAYQIGGSAMADLLVNVEDSFNSHYFEGPVANPNWSSDKDPWKLTGKDDAPVTFTEEWKMGDWFGKAVWSQDLSAADMTARCSYYDNGSNDYSSYTYQTLCNGLGARSSLDEAIENIRWNAINWTQLTGSGEGPFVPADNVSKSLRDKWQVVNYAREALWKRELNPKQKEDRCELFSISVATDSGTVNLKTLCVTAAAASAAPDNFWKAMEKNCWGEWNHTDQEWTTEPVLGQDKCINSDNNTALNNLTGNDNASIDIDWDGNADSVKRWEKWKLINKATEAVWNRNLDKTVRQNRCSNLSSDNASSSSDSDFDNVETSLKDLCLTAVNSDSAITDFDSSMSALTEGPFVNWSLTFSDNDTKRIQVSGTEEWEKTYKLFYDNGTAVQWPNDMWSWWKYDSRTTDNTTFPGKHTVANYLEQVRWNFQSDWNATGMTASEISLRCEFFTATDNISGYCSQMPIYVEGQSVLSNILRNSRSNIPVFVNTSDSRIIKSSSNGYLFDDPDSTLTLYTRVFPKETFNGSTTWSSSTTFNSNQVFALLFTFMEGRSQIPIPANPVYGDLDNLTTNQKAWLHWDLFTQLFMGDEKDMIIPMVNALDNPSVLR